MKRQPHFVSFVCLSVLSLLLAGCSTNTFRIKGIYKAPLSGFQLEVVGWGNLDANSALSGFGEYDAYIVPLPGGKTRGEAFHFEWRYPDTTDPSVTSFKLVTGAGEQSFEENVILEDVMEDTLYSLGYETYDTYEVQEAIFAVYGVAFGPDTVVQTGATKYLEVVEIDLEYEGD
jgi:hypothetical protein